jgi:adenylate kinase family enzyme
VRISVLGTSGSGKTTVGRAAAQRLGVPFLELDSVRHQRNWTELPDDEFRRHAAEMAATDAWVIDGNYRIVRDITTARATRIVWLDPPRWRVMTQVARRSLGRVVFRRELWNGNRERWANLFSRDPRNP